MEITLKKLSLTLFTTLVMLGSISSVNATVFTPTKVMKVSFNETDIDASKVTVSFEYECTYEGPFIDIIQGRIGTKIKSCGKNKMDLKIDSNGELTLPAIESFTYHRKAAEFSRYSMNLAMFYKGKTLLKTHHINSREILDFYKGEHSLNFKQFELKDFEIMYKGLNLIDSPEFKGENTMTWVAFNPESNKLIYESEMDFGKGFYSRGTFKQLANGDLAKLGKISIKPEYFPFFNGEELKVTVDVWTRRNGTGGDFVKNKIEMPLTPEAFAAFKSIEIK
ncbi:MAG: hypothetical protein WC635_01195 [Bacteriovorax sp.]